jgi:hypothetical protein
VALPEMQHHCGVPHPSSVLRSKDGKAQTS